MSLRPFPRTARVLTVAGMTVALVTGAGALSATAANAATPASPQASSTPSAAPSTPTTKLSLPYRALSPAALRELVGKLPSALKSDVKALKGKKGTDRRSAIEALETKALDGGYGSAIESVATQAQAAWKTAPASLKADLKSLKGKSRTVRIAELKTIETKALDGGYGSTVETYAKGLKDQAAKRAAESAEPVLGSMV